MPDDIYAVDTAQISALRQYTACDISDALLKLKVPGAGLLPDLSLVSADPGAKGQQEVAIAPGWPVLFVPKGSSTEQDDRPPANIPAGAHWADLTPAGCFAVLRQPEGQTNAVCGGIMALRMAVLGAKGCAVLGRARDVEELRGSGMPVWARGLSTIGVGAASQPWAVGTTVTAQGGAVVSPGDLVFADPVNGVVVIPRSKVEQVLELLPRLTAADDKVKEAVLGGMKVQEAFKLHRSNL